MSKCSRSFIAIRNARIVVEASISDKINNYSCNAIQPNTCLTVSPLWSFLIVSVGWTIDFLAKKWKRVKNGEEENPCVPLLGAESRCSGGDKTPRYGTMKTKRGGWKRRERKEMAEIKVAEGSGRCLEAASHSLFHLSIVWLMEMAVGKRGCRWETRVNLHDAIEMMTAL